VKREKTTQPSVDEVLLDFRVDGAGSPSPKVLDTFCRAYPEYARELTNYAVRWLIDDALGATADGGELRTSSPLVSRAISRFHDQLAARASNGTEDLEVRSEAKSPFDGLSIARKREVRNALGIDTPLLAKFQNRIIDPDTAPLKFIRRLSAELGRTVDDLVSYLRLPPVMHSAPDFKSDRKPLVDLPKESFENAVKKSALSDIRKNALLED
jgi:hypothetical protein